MMHVIVFNPLMHHIAFRFIFFFRGPLNVPRFDLFHLRRL